MINYCENVGPNTALKFMLYILEKQKCFTSVKRLKQIH